jgi:hypothetical protein
MGKQERYEAVSRMAEECVVGAQGGLEIIEERGGGMIQTQTAAHQSKKAVERRLGRPPDQPILDGIGWFEQGSCLCMLTRL